MSNSDNPKNGADFQKQVQQYFIEKYGAGFELEKKIPIGDPPKDHNTYIDFYIHQNNFYHVWNM